VTRFGERLSARRSRWVFGGFGGCAARTKIAAELQQPSLTVQLHTESVCVAN
jgi:hypothetical protein